MSIPALVSGQMRYILVVDSTWNERFTLSMLLQRFGYTVANSNNAAEAVEFLCVAPAVAVFAEAGAAGRELVLRLKADARFRDTPIIMVCAQSDHSLDDLMQRGELAGLLRAPLNPEAVFQVIQRVIEKGTRENIRIATALPAVLRDGPHEVEGFATVLSQYGIFFRTLEPLPMKTRVRVSISIGDKSIDVEAVVLYIVSFEEGPFCEPGMGMKFVAITPGDKALINFFIHEQIGIGYLPGDPGQGGGMGQA